GWQQINLTGDYPWDAVAGLGPDGFRPLRSAAIDESPSRSETTGLADRPAWRESGPEKEPPEVRLTRPWRGESAANSSLKRPKFPASRENTGNFIDSRLGSASTAAKKRIKPERYGPIPYATEQGINLTVSGI